MKTERISNLSLTTITRFTKEQLIEKAKENVEFFRERLELLPQSQPMALSLRLAEIALASLEAEPVAWTDADELRDANNGGSGYLFSIGGDANKFADPRRQLVLYTAPPAPVVPTFDEWLEVRGNKPLGWVKDAMRESYDACRATMLQGKAEPVSNRDELPVSEIECDICGFKSTDPDGAHYCCEDNSND
ncbi:hypothetical protein [Citrobacter amalonaticus]|uniref:hypothetical protein n=1 Tax=Citrobacter amalonaticus TaxID=35703 RepID=UPI001E373FA0|nr:hypothetical protein [Citrobacter amalonaticus]GJK86904.1 hypothetical protein TUM17567_31990 [Citrobacter amalonaticus]